MVCLKLLYFACLFAVSFAGFPRKLRYQSDQFKDLQVRSGLYELNFVRRFASQYENLNKLAVKYAIFKIERRSKKDIIVPEVISRKIETKTSAEDKKWYEKMLTQLSNKQPRYVVFKTSMIAGGLPFHFVSVTNWLPNTASDELRALYKEHWEEFEKIFKAKIKDVLTYTAEDREDMAYE